MSDVTLIDPLGRRIIFHDRTWFGHILRGHPEMATFRDKVELTVKHPDEIRFSQIDEQCRQYYSVMLSSGLRIVVIIDNELAIVKTAYLTKKVKGGTVEWSRPTQ